MKSATYSTHPAIAIPAEIAVKCDGPDQFETFDRGVRAFLAVPKSAVLKEEAKWNRAQIRKRSKKAIHAMKRETKHI